MLEWINELIRSSKFANRSEVIIQALTEFLSSEKNSIRAFPRNPKQPSIFSEHVRKVKEDLRRAKI